MIRYSLTVLNIILVTLAAYIAVSFGYQWIDSLASTVAVKPAGKQNRSPKPQARQRPLNDYRIIVNSNLFGTKGTRDLPAPKNIDLEGLQQTKLQLVLWGTVSGHNQKAYAVIEDKKAHRQQLYHVGDTVQNARVKLILREKVVLSVDGRDEILEMEKPKTGSGNFRASSARSESGQMPRTKQKITLKRSMIENATRDVTKLMTQVNIHPYLEEGQPAGLALSNIRPSSIFRRMGLRNGDVLVGVNGQEIRSLDDALGLYDSLKTASNVTVAIKRRGRLRAIEYDIR